VSLAVHAEATPAVLKFPIVAEDALDAVCLVMNTVVLIEVMSFVKQFHPVVAVGSPITPLVATPPVPTFIVNAAVPLLLEMLGLVPNPDEMVGAVLMMNTRPLLSLYAGVWTTEAIQVPPFDRLAIDPAPLAWKSRIFPL
jgi:hypothetical protein